MIKRLIFDIDNTLIMWKEEYREALRKTIEYYNLDLDYVLVDNLIEVYEESHDCFSKQAMLNLINEAFNCNLTLDFIDYWLKEMGNMAEIDRETIETLDYLSQKYELVILTNWFRDSQIARLKTVGIEKYFKEFYGAEEFMKPDPNSFKAAMNGKNIDECIMIGDTYKTDIIGAINIGMRAIMVSNEQRNDIETIKEIKDLKEIL